MYCLKMLCFGRCTCRNCFDEGIALQAYTLAVIALALFSPKPATLTLNVLLKNNHMLHFSAAHFVALQVHVETVLMRVLHCRHIH